MFSDAKTVIPVLNASGASLLLAFKSWSDLHFQRAAIFNMPLPGLLGGYCAVILDKSPTIRCHEVLWLRYNDTWRYNAPARRIRIPTENPKSEIRNSNCPGLNRTSFQR